MSLLKESLEISYVTMGKFLIASITVWVQVLCSSAQCFHYHSLLQASHLLLKPSNCEERGMLELGLLHYSKTRIQSLSWCTGVWNQGFRLVRQCSTTSPPFALLILERKSHFLWLELQSPYLCLLP
jgi:hypothetical protein